MAVIRVGIVFTIYSLLLGTLFVLSRDILPDIRHSGPRAQQLSRQLVRDLQPYHDYCLQYPYVVIPGIGLACAGLWWAAGPSGLESTVDLAAAGDQRKSSNRW